MLKVVTHCVYFFPSFSALYSHFSIFLFKIKYFLVLIFFSVSIFFLFATLYGRRHAANQPSCLALFLSLSHKIRCKRCPHERFKTRASRALSLCLSICSLFSPLNFANIKAIIAVYSAYLQQTEMPHSSKFCCCLC